MGPPTATLPKKRNYVKKMTLWFYSAVHGKILRGAVASAVRET